MIPLILAGLAGLVIAVVFMLKFREVIDWFVKQPESNAVTPISDKDPVIPMLIQSIENKEHKTIKLFFNRRKRSVVKAEATKSKKIDDELKSKPSAYIPRKEIVNEVRG